MSDLCGDKTHLICILENTNYARLVLNFSHKGRERQKKTTLFNPRPPQRYLNWVSLMLIFRRYVWLYSFGAEITLKFNLNERAQTR